jgi:serine phosphatase RsbU (regulator of sigma subunit)
VSQTTISIRRSLLTNLIAIVLVLGVAILGMTFVGSRRTLRGFSQSLIDQTLSRVVVQLDGFFDPVARELQTLEAWSRAGLLNLDDPADLNARLSVFMQEYPWVTSCMVADDLGREHMVLRQGNRWRNRQLIQGEDTGQARWLEWSEAEPDPVESEEALEYDPRLRPWFQGAASLLESSPVAGARIHWTEPYTFFTTQAPGITASMAHATPDGGVRVIGLDVLLTDISRFTREIDVHERGAAFVLTEDGRLVGLPSGYRSADEAGLRDALLKHPAELGTPVARDLSAALLSDDSVADRATRFESDDGAWWGQLRRDPLGPGRYLQIGVAVPEADLLGNVLQQRIWIGVLTAIVLTIAVGRAVILANRYSRPVEELVRESERISTGDLEPGSPIETRVDEVHRLAEAHDKMRDGLKTLLKIEHDLKIARRIQESTYPEKLPELDGFEIAAWSEPADETGGDTYDVIGIHGATIGDKIVLTDGEAGRAVLLLADATGHGIGPALSVVQVRAMLRIAVRMSSDLSEIATHMNQQLCADLPGGHFITCWLGELSSSDGRLGTLSAGQGPLLWYRAGRDEFETRSADVPPLGLFDSGKIEVPSPTAMERGDIYAAISDGIYEAADPDEAMLGEEPVMQVIRDHRESTASEILAAVREAAETFARGRPPDDDRTIIIIKRA